MTTSFKKNKILILMIATISPSVPAEVIFNGDVNQDIISDPKVSYSEDVIVGDQSTGGSAKSPSGTLDIDNGSKVRFYKNLFIGNGISSSGRVIISGSGSTLKVDQKINIASAKDSYGEINVVEGARLSSQLPSTVGSAGGATAVANVSGLNSLWKTAGTLTIGAEGAGTLNIEHSGEVDALTLRIANSESSSGAVNVNGGTLNVSGSPSIGYAYIGFSGTGHVNVTNAGKFTDSYTLMGGPDGNGTLYVEGAHSVFSSKRFITVGAGEKSTALVSVLNGGTLMASSSQNPDNGESLVLGNASGSSGTVLVSDVGSVVNAPGITVVGKGGGGEIFLWKEGSLNTDAVIIAEQQNSLGTLNIGGKAGSRSTSPGQLNSDAIVTFGQGSGTLNFNHTNDDYLFNNLVMGNGNVDINGGTTVLTAANTWTGETRVNGGSLKAGAENTFSPYSDYYVAKTGTLNLNGYNQSVGNLTNGGIINLNSSQPGTNLNVNGNYEGSDGLLIFSSVLEDDNSVTDRLTVSGNTSGTSRVAVTNLGGKGARTLNGIEIIRVSGNSSGEFIQQGRIIAGAWEYNLTRGKGESSANWYLSSYKEDNDDNESNAGEIPSGDEESSGGDTSGGTESHGGSQGEKNRVLRPEAGAYIANIYASENLFRTNLSDRLGDTEYTDSMTGQQRSTSLWMKNTGSHSRYSDKTGQLKTRANSYSLLLGGDLAALQADNGSSLRVGALAGYGYSDANTVSSLSGYGAKSSIKGYTAGLYSTWFAEGSSELGPYLDGVLQYNWFHNSVYGEDLTAEKYDSKGLSATLETGYVLPFGGKCSCDHRKWYIQPKASVSWSGIDSNNHRESNGTNIEGKGANNITTRLGIKSFLKERNSLDNGKYRNFKPYAEASWIHNTESRGVKMDGSGIDQAGTQNIGELRFGVDGRISQELNLTGFIAQQLGDKGYSDTQAVLGVKYSF